MNMVNGMSIPTNTSNVNELLGIYDLDKAGLERIRKFADIILPKLEEIVQSWYKWQEKSEAYDHFFSDPQIVERVKPLQINYWMTFFKAEIDQSYVHNRYIVGETHARIGLPMHTYFSGMNMFLKIFWEILTESKLSKAEQLNTGEALCKLLHLDTAIVVESYTTVVNEQITSQSRAMMEMSTPVTQIWNGILFLPLVGIIDSKRAQDIMNATLAKIAQTQARAFILDISGVGVVDTAVANHLIKITKATRLMGCESIISGVSPAISQTIVELGIDVGSVKTTATMQDALSSAFRRTGMTISESGK